MRHRISLVLTTAALELSVCAVHAAELPVACIAGSCGTNIGFVTSGQASATSSGNTLTVQQASDKAILNWQSFNIGADGHVTFKQPGASSVALNKIHDTAPSRIFGALEANGQVYLLNPNGVVFGATAQVKTAGLLASTLNMDDAVFDGGILSAVQKRDAALKAETDPDGKVISGDLVVQQGARITTTGAGGRILLAAPNVQNSGTLEAPDGQVILAAGEKVYLSSSSDASLRGLLVEVDGGGEAANRLTGSLSAARGNITLVGLAVNQEGRASATTSVSANGSIRLLSRDTVSIRDESGTAVLDTSRTGKVELGAQSFISILPELADTTTAVDDQKQNLSTVEIMGHNVGIRGGARIVAPGGNVKVSALVNPSAVANGALPGGYDADSQVRVENGATIDVSGSDVTLAATRSVVAVELRANELKDAPVQRDGFLRGKTVYIDVRTGTPLADVSGAIAAIPKNIAERTSKGGSVAIHSQGDVGVATGATMDVSGGVITYAPGVIQTTQLIGADGKIVDIGNADPNKQYVGLVNPAVQVKYDRWGVTETVRGPGMGNYVEAFSQGANAGSLQFAAPNLALNGTLRGSVYQGPLQRNAALAASGGTLIIGTPTAAGAALNDYRAPSVTFVRQAPSVLLDDEPILNDDSGIALSTDYLTAGGFTSTRIYSNGTVTVPRSTPLELAPGSSFTVLAKRVDVDASITALGGSISLTSDRTLDIGGLPGVERPGAGVFLGANTVLDVSGLWTNDTSDLSNPIRVNAGSIVLNAKTFIDDATSKDRAATLSLGAGSQLLANGGAWRKSNGSLVAGSGGSISLAAQRANQTDGVIEVGENVGLQAFGVQGANGGQFSLTGARIDIVDGPAWASEQRFDASEKASARALQLGDELFSGHGFTSFSILADGVNVSAAAADGATPVTSVLTVKSGAVVDTRTSVLALAAGLGAQASGGTIAGFSTLATPFEWARPASSLTLSAQPRVLGKTDYGQVAVESGSVIRGAARSAFTFESLGGVTLAGQIVAPAGTITAKVPTPSTPELDPGYLADLRIKVASGAVLDTSGVSLLKPNDTGLQFGDVLAGGSVSLFAERGSVELHSGSKIDVSGAAAALDIADSQSATRYTRQTIASAAGGITLHAPESILIAGDLEAHGGVGDVTAGRAAGGSLSVELTRDAPFQVTNQDLIGTFPTPTRTIRIVPDAFAGSSLPNGQAILSVGRIESSGIDSLSLYASDFLLGSGGKVSFDAGVNLSLGRQLIVDSPVIDIAAGAPVRLSGPYVSLGYAHRPGSSLPTATTGFGQLEVNAGQLDLVGTLALQRAGKVTLSSSGDLRLRGVIDGATNQGRLEASGDLTLAAARIYPTTLTDYTVNVSGDVTNTLRIAQNGKSSGTPLSAAGAVRLAADEIVQGGTLLAPFGKISLDAVDSVKLLAGSVTSVSAKGALIPFGNIQVGSGTEWMYTLGGNVITQDAIPDRNVSIAAPDVVMANGSTVDVSGGGDLYAYSWTPGTGGSKDALAAGATPGLYAVIPGLSGLGTADPQEYQRSDLKVGDSVYLNGGAGLDAGVYTLLPARYALLPGAYLVHAVSGYNDLRPGKTVSLADGSTVVSGYRTFADTGLGDSRYSGFAVTSGSYGRKLATYEDFKASEFFPARAVRLGSETRVPLPSDAGALSIAVTRSLEAKGSVLTAAGDGGRGAAIDISASHLEITNGSRLVAPDVVQIDTSVLTGWNPGSLLLGGKRNTADGSVEVTAQSVAFLSGTSLSLSEVMAVATDTISIGSGAQVSSKSAGGAGAPPVLTETKVKLTGDAAVLAVSDRSDFTLERSGATDSGGGQIEVAAGGRVASRGALLLDAPDGARLDGTLDGQGATWSLGSRHVAFADDAVDGGLTITSSLINALERGSAARIHSSGAIDFLSSVQLGNANDPGASALKSLTLSAATLGAGDSSIIVDLAAKSIVLAGVATDTSLPLASGGATLRLSGADVRIQDGALNVEGFASTTLRSSGALLAEGDSTLRTPGALELSAGRLSTLAGAKASFESGDLVRVTRAGADPGAAITSGLGGSLSIAGKQIELGGNIVLPSGALNLKSEGDLAILTGAVLDVSGVNVTAGGRTVSSSGGVIDLKAGGKLNAAAGSLLNVSGGRAQDAGGISFLAGGEASIGSTLKGAADSSARGASVLLEADSLRSFAGFNSLLESGGFAEKRAIHVTRGDLDLARGASITARDVELTTDLGAIRIAGTVNADSNNARGVINLFAGGNIGIQNGGVLRSRGVDGLGRGGLITLGSSRGAVSILGGSTLDTQGKNENGRVLLRASARSGNDVAVDGLAGTFTGVESLTIEPVLAVDAPTFLTRADLEDYRAQLATYASAAIPQIRQRLAAPNATPWYVQPGLELRVDGDLQIDGGANLATWRFGDALEAGALTFRATGSISITNGTISDGFRSTGVGPAARLDVLAERSSTLRFTAGASLASANPLAVIGDAAGDITIQDSIVRTGTGDLLFSAARDITFALGDTGIASVYTGGQLNPDMPGVTTPAQRIFIAMPTNGGALSLTAGRDIVGNDVSQSMSAWQRRIGQDFDSLAGPVRWGVDAQRFQWNAGTFGGGDLTIRAGQDVREIAAAAADSGYQVTPSRIELGRGGVLSVDTGHDLSSSMLHVSAGVNRVTAGGSLSRTRESDGIMLGTMLSIQDAKVNINARGEVFLESALNPTLLTQIGTTQQPLSAQSYFFTYTDQSGLSVQSASGDVNLAAAGDRLRGFLGDIALGSIDGSLALLPSNVSLQSMSRDVVLGGSPLLYASDSGQLDIFAARDIQSNAFLTMLDTPAAQQPTPLAARASLDLVSGTQSARHVRDLQPVLLSAGRDIVSGQYALPKSARVIAERDIRDIVLRDQNLRADDRTLLVAGRDIAFPVNNDGRIETAGPGRLDVIAGRNVDLGFSQGITTTGRLSNPAIASAEGADVTVLAGVLPQLDPDAKVVPKTVTDFFNDLVKAGREANVDPTTNFERGYAAIDKLFPGSRDKEDGVTSPFAGDLLLAFSRIYTLAGGNISLLAPGGHVDVGLAVPPIGAPTRTPSQLGIVAQGAGDVRIFAANDVLVNSSRVFTLGGGDIAIWSTAGDIDAGRGSKSSVSAPAPTITVDDKGNVSVNLAGAVAGSGIRSIVTDPSVKAGNVDLVAPKGIVNAGDAGIGAAGNLNVAAQQVVGLDNIQVGGSSAGVPADVSNLGASLSGVSAVASSASSASGAAVSETASAQQPPSLAESVMGWLDVFVEGFGEEVCKPNDAQCMQRNSR